MTDIKLWPFQDEDLTKLQPQQVALILWAMGLGKTFGAVERDRRLREEHPEINFTDPTLIIAPLSTHEQWDNWINEVYDAPSVYVFSQDRDFALECLQKRLGGFYVLHWELLRSANPRYWATKELYPVLTDKKYPFFHVIADEVHRAKSRTTQQAKVLKKIPTKYKTGLTGTPITNKPPDLWSILNWLRPKDWTSYWRFFNTYAEWRPQYRGSAVYKEYLGPKNSQELVGKIASFTVQRRKEDVLTDLPDRYYTTIRVDLDPKQRRAYDSMRRDMVAWIGANEETPLVASATVAKLQRLQQFAIAHADISEDGTVSLSEPSSKLDAVIELLEESPEEQFVIFSQFKQSIRLLASRLEHAGVTYSVFTGDVGHSDRRIELDRFTSGRARCFLATIGAGGEGIDGLQRASTTIFIDRSWSPAANDQAESRLHRAGQKNAVHVIDIVARDTVDQLKASTLKRKTGWIKDVLDGLGG